VSSGIKAKINFLNFSVRESHIVFKEPGKYKINVGFTPKGFIFPKINQYHIVLDIRVKDEGDKFHINIVTESIFDYDSKEDIEKLIDGEFTFNAPAIIFPYVRAYISSLTALSGMATLVLPTLNLSELGAELKKSIAVISE
jgi:preprotein translocase subunit SecB